MSTVPPASARDAALRAAVIPAGIWWARLFDAVKESPTEPPPSADVADLTGWIAERLCAAGLAASHPTGRPAVQADPTGPPAVTYADLFVRAADHADQGQWAAANLLLDLVAEHRPEPAVEAYRALARAVANIGGWDHGEVLDVLRTAETQLRRSALAVLTAPVRTGCECEGGTV